ncbi:MAG TPA: RNB domain-containing ribonuclease [Opitutaceae bacterium]
MPNTDDRNPRSVLQKIARRVMAERGLEPDFSPAALAQLSGIRASAVNPGSSTRDLRALPWCSIDNDDSRDLDQLSVAEELPGGAVKLLVAIADVDGLVVKGSAIDDHARENTTSVYTAGGIFPMLPEELSTDLTSLGFNADRVAFVVEMTFDKDGALKGSDVYEAVVKNKAKLAYNAVAAWLDGTGPMPEPIAPVAGLDANIRLQHKVAEQLRALRHMRGALSLQTLQARPVFDGNILRDLLPDQSNVAKSLIEELMVAANGVTARYLTAKHFPSIRRVVRTPSKWDRIVELAAERGSTLPGRPDGKALEQFLLAALKADAASFPDLSLCVIKLLGRGEYVVEFPGGAVAGHFGLAVADYAHSTAPNRRFPDLLIQRLLKAAMAGSRPPYPNDELTALAQHCTEQEDAAKKVERQVVKSAGAMLLAPKIGSTFDATVTGSSDKGTWVRIFHPPVEGKLVKGYEGKQVGDRIRVRLTFTDVERGYIDFDAA